MKHLLQLLTLTLIIVISSACRISAQQGNVKIGSDVGLRQNQGAFFDYSDAEAVNIKVSVWGFVKYPGYYLVPSSTTPKELLSYAGGPTDAARLDDLRIYRVDADSNQTMIKFGYNDLLWGENLTTKKEKIPTLIVGDVLVIPGEPKMYFRDTLSLTLAVASTLTSIAILIVSLLRK